MATATQFVQYWALAFVSLSVALVLLSLFYRFTDFDLDLHSLRKEALIAGIASVVQGAGFWFSASLFQGDPFRRLLIPGAIVAIIYWLSHLEDWSGYEIGGISLFQGVILNLRRKKAGSSGAEGIETGSQFKKVIRIKQWS